MNNLKIIVLAAIFATMASIAVAKKKSSTVSVNDLRTERMVSPMSIATATPRLGWIIESSKNDVMQTGYHIIVASTKEKAEALQGDLWDAAESSDQSQWITYKGKRLKSNTRCYWRVKVETNKGTTEWSDIAMWNVGLLAESDWSGRWIGLPRANSWDVETEHSRLSSRYLRKEFSLSKQVARATLYISGLGLYEAYINGKKVGNQVLAPAPTDYRKTVLYNAFDVTSLMAEKNAIGVALGNGRFYTMQQNKKPYKITNFGYPEMRLNLIIEFTDGTTQRIASDEKWKLNADGAIRSANEYDGEIYDARKEFGNWTIAGYDDSKWQYAERTAIPLGTLRGAMSENMKVVMTIKPKSVTKHGNGFIVDMGQNMAGWLKLKINDVKAGDSVVIRFAEKLDSTGNLYRANFRHAQSTDYYIANGNEKNRWWNPTFVYHGFRYAEITGLKNATVNDFIGEVINDDMEETGSFESNDTIVNAVYRNAVWGIRSNYKGMPVDCPQRDERQPWLGDRTRGCYGEAFVFDNGNLYTKWARDITEAQREDGCIPDVAPAFWNYFTDDITWPAALPAALDMLRSQYGDDKPLETYYPNVTRWLRHMRDSYGKDGLITKDKYGDWCVPPTKLEQIHSTDPNRNTDGVLIATAYYYKLCKEVAAYAKKTGRTTDAAEFESEAKATKEAFNKKYLTINRGSSNLPGHILHPDSTFYGNNTVTANLLPLTFGMIDDEYVKGEVEKNIITAIEKNSTHNLCGVIGIGWLMHALTDMGRSDMAWQLAVNKTYPSWGYMVENGATTIWELWNGDKANPAMNSGNHIMLLGDLISWLYEDVAGIASDKNKPGFKHIIMKPDFSVDEMDDIRASYKSIYGCIVSHWKKINGNTLIWHIEIPANTTATIYLPDGSTKEIGSGSHDIKTKLKLQSDNVVTNEFIYKHASFPQCHSITAAENKKGDLLATYFGGTRERDPDVCIYVSTKKKGSDAWGKPMLVADGVMTKDEAKWCHEKFGWNIEGPVQKGEGRKNLDNGMVRYPCWNPVIYKLADGTMRIDFKIGPKPSEWRGWTISSKDGGKTWSKRTPLPDGFLGAIKNKPIINNGRIISPTSDESDGWRVYFEYSDDMGKTWKKTPFVDQDKDMKTIQPTIIKLADGRLEALTRSRSRYIARTFSSDNGLTWSKIELTDVPNNNSGIDAVSLKDGGYVMVCNDRPIEKTKTKGDRTPLSLLRSDDGITWRHWITLEDSPISQYSYPSIIQTSDGLIHAIYTWRRLRVKHVVVKP